MTTTTPTPYDPTAPLGRNLASVEASAGTGKTWSITSTVLRLVAEDGLAMERLLVVTFTRAATAELVDRVRGRLDEALVALRTGEHGGDRVLRRLLDDVVGDDDEHRAEVRRRIEGALRDVDDASITTLHGFAHRVLTRASLLVDAEPVPTLDSERDAALLLEEVVDDWSVRLLRAADPTFVSLVTGDLRLGRDGRLAIGRAVLAEPDLRLIPAPDDRDPREVHATARQRLRQALERDADADRAWLEQAGVRTDWSWGVPRATAALDRLRSGSALDLDELREYSWSQKPPSALNAAERRGLDAPPFARACDAALDAVVEVETLVRTQLAAFVRDEVRRRRAAEARVGFADLLAAVGEAVRDDTDGAALRATIGRAYDAVLVDEFQDTDPTQWAILRGLFDQVRHFEVVGDPKQAIYGWRGADLETYKAAVAHAEHRSTMRTNHRSDRRYVAACNHLFAFDGSLGEVDYERVDAADDDPGLLSDDATPLSGVELRFHARGPDERVIDVVAGRRLVAARTAADIVRTLERRWTIPDGRDEAGRPRRREVEPRDCVVLVRTNADATATAEALRDRGVTAVLAGGRDVYESHEAEEIQSLLAVLLDPTRARLVRRVMTGTFGGLDATAVDDLSPETQDLWAERLTRWRSVWERHGVGALLETALREVDAERRLAAQVGGERAMTDIRHLAELLAESERGDALGPHALHAWLLARRADAAEDDGRAPEDRELRLESDEQAVRVLTIHAAKGLEFPLVWVPFLWTPEVRPPRRDTRTRPFVVNDPAADDARTLVLLPAAVERAWEDDRQVTYRRMLDEASWAAGLRLAYVAMTRARHRAVVDVGGFKALRLSPAWHLLCSPTLGAHDLAATSIKRSAPPDDDELLDAIASRCDDDAAVGLVVVPPDAVPSDDAWSGRTDDVPGPVTAARWPDDREVIDLWGRTSFTALLRRRPARDRSGVDRTDPVPADVGDAADRDATSPELGDALVPAATAASPVPMAAVPRGATWGVFLHAVYEHLPGFAADDQQVVAVLRDQARLVPGIDPATVDAHLDALRDGIARSLVTPLGPQVEDLTLAEVGPEDRLDEPRFTIALADRRRPITVGLIADVLAAHADDEAHAGIPLAAAAEHLRDGGRGRPVHGVLEGAIDLLLRDRRTDRFWIVDYKSNGLGEWVDDDSGTRTWVETVAHHTPERVRAAMVHGDYVLQATLYSVALHRHLLARLGDDYRYDDRVGGWAYLFVRGMTGREVLRDDRGRPHGIATGRPSATLVADLEDLLGGPTEGLS